MTALRTRFLALTRHTNDTHRTLARVGPFRVVCCVPGWYGRGYTLQLIHGRGAGYLGGWTLFLAWNSGQLHWYRTFRTEATLQAMADCRLVFVAGLWEFGFTRNANRVPYA